MSQLMDMQLDIFGRILRLSYQQNIQKDKIEDNFLLINEPSNYLDTFQHMCM